METVHLESLNKLYYTIGEVSSMCDVKPHVLRYWEDEFPMLKPVRRNKRRYYQPSDITLIVEIYNMLQQRGLTISGARQVLENKENCKDSTNSHTTVKEIIRDISSIYDILDQ